jgi:hypothetical protein
VTPTLPDKIVAVDRRLAAAGIDHAFGGALALAYYAEPRATIDIDVNLFVATSAYPSVADALAPLGVATDADLPALVRDGQCRVWWEHTPLDLFFAYDDIHEAMRRTARIVPFGEDRLPILAPEHLVVCKVVFDRAKDWLDIEQVLVCVDELDVQAMRSWLARLLGGGDGRAERFEQLLSLRAA